MPSTVIRSADYDAARSELTIVFADGRIYVYSLVPADVGVAMKTVPSKGAYFNQKIRDRNIPVVARNRPDCPHSRTCCRRAIREGSGAAPGQRTDEFAHRKWQWR